VHALSPPAGATSVRDALLAETGSLGVRAVSVRRYALARAEVVVDVDGCPIRVKRAGSRLKVEHDDAVAAAHALGIPLREVLVRAEAAARAAL
jgi:uncharacterized protein (DUF111 family)